MIINRASYIHMINKSIILFISIDKLNELMENFYLPYFLMNNFLFSYLKVVLHNMSFSTLSLLTSFILPSCHLLARLSDLTAQ